MSATISVLETSYVEPKRPYSQMELNDKRNKLFADFRLGKTKAIHKKCKHFYYVKANGRKEKDILEQADVDCGNCSVCWKLHRTPYELKDNAKNLIYEYQTLYQTEEESMPLTYDMLDVENCFYKWLCNEFL